MPPILPEVALANGFTDAESRRNEQREKIVTQIREALQKNKDYVDRSIDFETKFIGRHKHVDMVKELATFADEQLTSEKMKLTDIPAFAHRNDRHQKEHGVGFTDVQASECYNEMQRRDIESLEHLFQDYESKLEAMKNYGASLGSILEKLETMPANTPLKDQLDSIKKLSSEANRKFETDFAQKSCVLCDGSSWLSSISKPSAAFLEDRHDKGIEEIKPLKAPGVYSSVFHYNDKVLREKFKQEYLDTNESFITSKPAATRPLDHDLTTLKAYQKNVKEAISQGQALCEGKGK